MSDLMSNITDFSDLKNKYQKFSKPVISLSVISKSNKDKFVIKDLNIELSCGFSANMATFNVYNVFDGEKKKFNDDKFNQIFQIGKKINISVGYGSAVECVFSGFISGVTYIFSEQDMPHLNIECLDVKAIMMSNNNNKQIIQENYTSSINDIINKSAYKPYYKTADIDGNIKSPNGDDKFLMEMTNESDYDFIVRVAQKLGYEFFVSQETLYFRKKRIKTEPIMTISNKNAIATLEANLNIVGMVDSVEVRNFNDKDGSLVKSSVKSNATYSNSSSASKITQGSVKVIIDSTVTSDNEAQIRANEELDKLAWSFGTFLIRTIGLPEIIPGRFIKIEDLSKDINKKVYIVKVTHHIDDNGFKTSFEGRINSL